MWSIVDYFSSKLISQIDRASMIFFYGIQFSLHEEWILISEYRFQNHVKLRVILC